MSSGWFITGTDTGVGKTLITSALLHALAAQGKRVIGMKPVASGCTESGSQRSNEDAEQLIAVSNIEADYDTVCPYRFLTPIAPHLAAAEEGVEICIDRIINCYQILKPQADRVLVEGVGGWAVPINEQYGMGDVAVRLGLPVVIVVGARLGCISHALLTQQCILDRGLPLAGWVYNHIDPDMQRSDAVLASLHDRMSAPLLGSIPFMRNADPQQISTFLDLDQ